MQYFVNLTATIKFHPGSQSSFDKLNTLFCSSEVHASLPKAAQFNSTTHKGTKRQIF